MSQFQALEYVNADAARAPVDPFHPDSPYFGHSPLARSVLMGSMSVLEWRDAGDRQRRASFKSSVVAVLDPASDLLEVVLHFSDPEYRVPMNAIVLNPDASLHHRIVPPPFVEQVIEELPGRAPVSRRMPVEAFKDVMIQNGRSLFGLNFGYEWIERRYYDPARRQWQERELIFRN